ncbi:hypothetical protein DH2020_016730 [Rehmannia glutinosa]|uniref:SBP-type domain-containing protein n=1 Tax=Rehmannia glutinosa TaxID=99300 RepID=A0ABR0WT34_REHGL
MEKGSSSSSSSSSAGVGGADSLNGLKFGKKIYFEGVGSSGLQPKTSGGPLAAAAPPPSPAKKGRTGLVQGGQPPRCQVEGCKVDLSDAKAYYSRHKVCGMHSKSSTVIVAGLEQRFCQQCSSFVLVVHSSINCLNLTKENEVAADAFAGHNERRRKPPPGSLLSPRYATLCPSMFDNNHSKTGGFVMDFALIHLSLEEIRGQTQRRARINKSSCHYRKVSTSMAEQLTKSSVRSSSDSGVSDSSNALSLLSNQPWDGSRSRSSSLGVNNFIGQPSDNPSVTIGQFVCSSWGFKGNEGNSGLHEMPPDLGLGQTSHHASGQYNGELGLGQPSEDSFTRWITRGI